MISAFDIIMITITSICLLTLPLTGSLINKYIFYWKKFFKGMFFYLVIRFLFINPLENICHVYIFEGFFPIIVRIVITAIISFIFIAKFKNKIYFQSFLNGFFASMLYIDIVRILLENMILMIKLGNQAVEVGIFSYLLLLLSVAVGYLLLITSIKYKFFLMMVFLCLGMFNIYFNNIILMIISLIMLILFNYKEIKIWEKN